MHQPYRKLIFWLLLGAVVTFAVALSLLNTSHTADVDAEVGKWLLTVTAALVFGQRYRRLGLPILVRRRCAGAARPFDPRVRSQNPVATVLGLSQNPVAIRAKEQTQPSSDQG